MFFLSRIFSRITPTLCSSRRKGRSGVWGRFGTEAHNGPRTLNILTHPQPAQRLCSRGGLAVTDPPPCLRGRRGLWDWVLLVARPSAWGHVLDPGSPIHVCVGGGVF